MSNYWLQRKVNQGPSVYVIQLQLWLHMLHIVVWLGAHCFSHIRWSFDLSTEYFSKRCCYGQGTLSLGERVEKKSSKVPGTYLLLWESWCFEISSILEAARTDPRVKVCWMGGPEEGSQLLMVAMVADLMKSKFVPRLSSVRRPSVLPFVSHLSLNLMHRFLSNFCCSFPCAFFFFEFLKKKSSGFFYEYFSFS